MSSLFSDAIMRLPESAASAMAQRARDMRGRGIDVVSLAIGQPDFDTPLHIKAAAKKAIDDGDTKYPPVAGTLALKQAIAHKFARDNDLEFAMDEVTVANGGKQILFNAMLATLQTGDEIIIPAPYWMSYSDIAVFAGAAVVRPNCSVDAGYKLTAAQLEAAISSRTKWFLFNSPGNPSGALYSAAELTALADVLRRYPHVWVMSDEIYEHLVHEGEFVNLLNVAPDLRSRTLIVNGVSKAYCMTGWRIGFAAGPAALIEKMAILQSQSSAGACAISQAAAATALTGDQSCIEANNHHYRERLALVMQRIDAIGGLRCPKPAGAFYVFPDCSDLLGRRTAAGNVLNTDADVAMALLEDAHVAVVQGSAFGVSACLRLSYATNVRELNNAMNRIETFVAELADQRA